VPGVAALDLHHLYRTVGGFLATSRGDLERELVFQDRDLFSQTLDPVFIDTTSTFVWRAEESNLRRRGYSRDRRPDQPQVIICLAVDRRGWPIASDILPGNTDDRTAFTRMIDTLRTRFHIGRVMVVADRGMVSQAVLNLLTGDPRAAFDYILGCRLRRDKIVTEDVLARAGRYYAVDGHPALQVKEVHVEDQRYIVCRNLDEAKKDSAAREGHPRQAPAHPRARGTQGGHRQCRLQALLDRGQGQCRDRPGPWSGTRGSTASSSCAPPPR
jgi:Transposase DDE domain